MTYGEAYADIVWRQFKKNGPALLSLWVLAPLLLLAIFAPLIASNQPFVFRDGGQTLYPWFRALFNPAEVVDFAFNMALVAFVPWLVASLLLNWIWKRRQWPGRRRLLGAVVLYAAVVGLLCAVFSLSAVRPGNKYSNRTFAEEQFRRTLARSASEGKEIYALYAPIPYGPTQQDLDSIYRSPGYCKSDPGTRTAMNDGFPHLLGTDDVGKDVLVRMIYGTRVSMTVGFVAVALYLVIGVVVGAVAGYFGGMVDILISRIIEIVLLFPSFFLILTLVALLGRSIYIIMAVIGITGWPTIARLTRGEVLKQRAMDYVAAARALGASHGRIIFRHILPNALSPALVSAPFGIAGAIITEAGLSLLGFGVPPPAPSWGSLLQLGNENYAYWWLILIPSLAIFLTVTIFNLVGNGLRDAMDPRLRK
ncbi:MAG: ABC transporter permease [Thermoguttaceae bacterium]|jgi:peptide/nickel transport system permease protein